MVWMVKLVWIILWINPSLWMPNIWWGVFLIFSRVFDWNFGLFWRNRRWCHWDGVICGYFFEFQRCSIISWNIICAWYQIHGFFIQLEIEKGEKIIIKIAIWKFPARFLIFLVKMTIFVPKNSLYQASKDPKLELDDQCLFECHNWVDMVHEIISYYFFHHPWYLFHYHCGYYL